MARIVEITDFSAQELDIYARLTEAQLLNRQEPSKGLFIAESPLVIERALLGGCEPVSMLVQKGHIEHQAADIIQKCGDVPVYTAEFDVLTQLTGFQLTRGILCAMRRPAPKTVREVCQNARRVAVLEDVMNPTNVGAIFRSAAALGMDAVLLTPSCCDPLYRRSVRVSMGTVFQIPWAYFDGDHKAWPSPGMEELKNLGFSTCAMALCDDSFSVEDPRLHGIEKLAVILGTEGDGLSKSTIAKSDYTVKIPMAHGVDSLNVAAASAVAFWELRAR